MRDRIAEFKQSSHTCLLLAHPDIGRLAGAVKELLQAYGWPYLSIGAELADVLLAEMPAHRPRRVDRWMRERAGALSPGPVLCSEIALLFEPSLALDPLRMLRETSRVARLVVAWPGEYRDNVLTYAVPAHRHYRAWRGPDVLIIPLE